MRDDDRILKLIESREVDELQRHLPDYIAQARVDMGFKHFAFALGALLTVPVGYLAAVLGARRFGAKQLVVAVETIHHRLGDVVGNRGVQAGDKHFATFLIAAYA